MATSRQQLQLERAASPRAACCAKMGMKASLGAEVGMLLATTPKPRPLTRCKESCDVPKRSASNFAKQRLRALLQHPRAPCHSSASSQQRGGGTRSSASRSSRGGADVSE
eukprot:3997158-Pleurochrysis_carterae.AAC.3